MTRTPEILRRIAQLGADDREWLLAHLSAADKERLLELLKQRRPAVAPPPAGGDAGPTSHDVLHEASPAVIADLLRHEPPWLVAWIAGARDWPWRRATLELLPPIVRIELQSLERSRASGSEALLEAAVAALRSRIAPAPASTAPLAGMSAFDQLVARVRRALPHRRGART